MGKRYLGLRWVLDGYPILHSITCSVSHDDIILKIVLVLSLQIDVSESLSLLSPALMQLGSSFLCFYLGSVAIKLMMQRLSFSLPLYLSLPTVLIVLVLRCEDILPEILAVRFVLEPQRCEASMDWSSGFAIILWIASLLWTTRHVWWFAHEKLAKRERLFVMPFYLGVFLVPSLLLNRRAEDKELNLESRGECDTEEGASSGDRWETFRGISQSIHCIIQDVITHPCLNFNLKVDVGESSQAILEF